MSRVLAFSIPQFLCPLASRSVRIGAKRSTKAQTTPLVQNIAKLETYIKDLEKTVKKQAARKAKEDDGKELSEEEITNMYLSLQPNESPVLPVQQTSLTRNLCKMLSIKDQGEAQQINWTNTVSSLIQTKAKLSTHDLGAILYTMPASARATAGQKLFDSMSDRANTFCCDLLMDAYASQKRPGKALEIFDRLRSLKLIPTIYSYAHLMKAFAYTKDFQQAAALYRYMTENKLEPNLIIYTSLIAAYARAGKVNEAFSIFDTIKYKSMESAPDTQVYSLMIYACSLDPSRSAEKASDLFQEMTTMGLKPTRETFNSLIHAYASRPEYFTEAWRMSNAMQRSGITLDKTTWHSLLSACAKSRDLERSRQIVQEMERIGATDPSWAPDIITHQLLFRAYAHARVRRSLVPVDVVEQTPTVAPTSIDSWISEQPFTSNSVLAESQWVLRRLMDTTPKLVSTQLLDTYMTIAQSFGAVDRFKHDWTNLYNDHAKGRYSYEIGLSASYTFKDSDLLDQVWSERQAWRSVADSSLSSSEEQRFGDHEAERLHIEALSRCNRLDEASQELSRVYRRHKFKKEELKCFQTKGVQMENRDAVFLYNDIFNHQARREGDGGRIRSIYS